MKNIVIIEDSHYYTVLLEAYCKHPEIAKKDYDFNFFESINDGINFINEVEFPIELIMCDLLLPDSNSWKNTLETISLYKKNGTKIAIIAGVSEEKMQEIIKDNLKNKLVDIDEYIIKDNISFHNFHQIIATLLGEKCHETI